MKYLKYILIVFILFLTPKVYAVEFNMNSYTSGTASGTRNRYNGLENYLYGGSQSTYQFGTRYNGRLTQIETYFHYPFEKNTSYTLTYNMNTEDFRNNFGGKYYWEDCEHEMNAQNQKVGTFTYISYKKVKFSFRLDENSTCVRVWLTSTQPFGNVYITGTNNWRLDSITLYDPDYQSGSGSGQGSSPSPSPSPSGASNQDIINNQNNNTQDIINNNNDNTNNIIDNNNENTDKIIDNQKELLGNKCPNTLDLIGTSPSTCTFSTDRKSVSCTGFNNDTYFLIKNMTSPTDDDYTLSFTASGVSTTNIKYTITGSSGSQYTLKNGVNTIHIPKNTILNNSRLLFDNVGTTPNSYNINFSNFILTKGTNYVPWCEFGSFTSKLDDTNSYLTDDSDPSINDNDFLDMFNSVGINDPLSYLLTLPTQLINKIVSLSDTCSSINLGTLYGVMITMPCINLENILGSAIWNIIDVIFSVSLLVVIFKNLYDTFSNLLTMGAEKEAKEKFSMPTPMDFLSMILGGDR